MYKKFTIPKGIPKGYAHKILLIMRLTTVILIASFLQVSAATFAQKVTLKQKTIPFKQVFKELEKQTGYTVIYFDESFDDNKMVNVNFSEAPLDQVMTHVLEDLPFSFAIIGKSIVIKDKPKTILNRILDVFNNIDVRGRVVDESGKGMPGAIIRVKDGAKTVITDNDGYFLLASVDDNAILTISYLGFQTQEVKAAKQLGYIRMQQISGQLEEVGVVSTGYQTIPKERATGSFTQINNTLINRSVSTNILDRLRGVTSGLNFTDNGNHQFGQSNIEVRGRATLFSNPNPLIIIDNFPYDGDINNINPNDIENVTVLKDAAAASAWGSRSGNGVIVITTKKGNLNSAPKVSFNANVNIGEKPDLYYTPQLSSSDYIDIEQFLFRKGAYNTNISNGYAVISPAVEIFLAKRNGTISTADSISMINALKGYDSREQISKYYYRPSVNQQYQASVSGGNTSQKYFVSAGYDKNLNSNVNSNYNRITLNASNTYYFLKNKLEFYSNILYSGSKSLSGAVVNSTSYPYTQLADANGNALVVASDLRPSYAATAGNGKLLNWLYKPLDELNNGYGSTTNNLTDYRLNFSLNYNILNGLKAAALYSYEKSIGETNQLYEAESYYARNLINRFSRIDPVSGAVTYPVPLGGILNTNLANIRSHNGRFQVNYDHSWGKHTLSAIAGTEIKDLNTFNNTGALYGYNQETATNQNAAVNYTALNKYFYNSSTAMIPTNTAQTGTTNRFFSYYLNASYTYNDRYVASFSARRDESNLFGVAANQKGVPLWSAGLAWSVNKEDFYSVEWLPQFKLRATYGYTGNVNNSISAYLTATSGLNNSYNASYATIVNPPNPSLRWERIRNLNLGIDFGLKNNRLTGSVDYWRKNGLDLIGNSPIAAQTGIILYTGNSANTLTKGADIQLNSVNLNGALKWYTTLLTNFSSSIVTDYKVSNGSNYNVVSANYNNPLQGYPYYSIFSFKYAGLDASGNPQGFLNGTVSENYTGIRNSTNRAELVYHGSATPTSFGNLRNTFVYKSFDLSFNISYKFGYYFRRNSVDNGTIYGTGGNNYKMPDYEDRWQNPGDELKTNVPSLIYPSNSSRTSIYSYSDVLVDKGDHIRLQDIKLGYTLSKKTYLPFNSINLFTYINNIGILWKANKDHIDPDFPTGIPMIRTFAFGLKADF